MTISQNDLLFPVSLHGPVSPEQDYEPQLITRTFFGVTGEAHIVGSRGGRTLRCEVTLHGYESPEELGTTRDAISDRILGFTGDLTVTIVEEEHVWPDCTFLGLTPREMPFLDGSGQYGWVQRGTLRWRQRT